MTPTVHHDVVTLSAMRFHGRIGVLPHEAEIAQSIEVDLSVWVEREAADQGARGVVDYRELYRIAMDVLSEGHIRYLEEVGERIAAHALRLPRVDRVRVAVRKPHVALPGPLAYAEVALERRRGE
jgi:7,8-dihydroneopterin aldolase/epimerase/oxygenase